MYFNIITLAGCVIWVVYVFYIVLWVAYEL